VTRAPLTFSAIGNRGALISMSSSTFRIGATAGSIRGEWNAPATFHRPPRNFRQDPRGPGPSTTLGRLPAVATGSVLVSAGTGTAPAGSASPVASSRTAAGRVTPSRGARTNLCEDLKVSIYFDDGSARITRDARQVLVEAAEMRTTCALGVVNVVGLADAVGDPQANLVLSEQRAKAVTQALGGLGFGIVRIEAAGAAGAATPAGELRPLRRRADLVFKSSGQ